MELVNEDAETDDCKNNLLRAGLVDDEAPDYRDSGIATLHLHLDDLDSGNSVQGWFICLTKLLNIMIKFNKISCICRCSSIYHS